MIDGRVFLRRKIEATDRSRALLYRNKKKCSPYVYYQCDPELEQVSMSSMSSSVGKGVNTASVAVRPKAVQETYTYMTE